MWLGADPPGRLLAVEGLSPELQGLSPALQGLSPALQGLSPPLQGLSLRPVATNRATTVPVCFRREFPGVGCHGMKKRDASSFCQQNSQRKEKGTVPSLRRQEEQGTVPFVSWPWNTAI
jgi:hypothetical protein